MRPELFSIGSFTVYSYGAMMALGILVGILVAEKRAPKLGLDADHVFNMGMWGAVIGLVGAKLLYWIVELPAILEDPSLMLELGKLTTIDGKLVYGDMSDEEYVQRAAIAARRVADMVEDWRARVR